MFHYPEKSPRSLCLCQSESCDNALLASSFICQKRTRSAQPAPSFIGSTCHYRHSSDSTSLVICEYSECQYHDRLFQELSIVFPDSLNGAVAKRRSAFLAGRYAAKCGALELSIPVQELPVSNIGVPKWPDDILGSITHTDTLAAALLSNSDSVFAVGLDIEEIINEETLQDVAPYITTGAERDLFGEQNHLSYAAFITVCFSAKESIYKALSPITQFFFGFEAATMIAINDYSVEFKIDKEVAGAVPMLKTDSVELQYQVLRHDHILTTLRL
jgi:enterobactin synthetase component D